ncbi:hypothetical protein L3X38_025258 [Prunus dulcis]|uniref:Retroviral polymerase SH3-like domain-containing protein n=1 Tax=Prunus dulcis TaxID=3755 RepID=A0AAD4Z6W5_PRUDU|nr:hypothetical protein L3X38_025258 [Prunus dulcis]
MVCLKERTDNCLKLSAHSYWICLFPIIFGDHVSTVSVSELPPKWCVACVHVYSHQQSKLDPYALRCVFIGCSSTQKGYKCYNLPTQKDERGSELEALGLENFGLELENDVFKDTALGKEMTSHTEESDRSPISEDETCGLYEETTGRPLEHDQSPISRDEAGALDIETTGCIQTSDQSPIYENNDSDSYMDEFNSITTNPPSCPASALSYS